MRKDDVIRLRHMLDAVQEAMSFARGKTRAEEAELEKIVLAEEGGF